MRELNVMEMDAVLGGTGNSSGGNGRSFIQNFAQCTADTITGAAVGAGAAAALGVGAVPFAIFGAVSFNLGSDACNSLPAPY